MNVKQLLFFFLLVCSFSLSAATIFVAPSGSADNSGQSWNAATTLNKALAIAQVGDQVWVAAGTYTPGNSRTTTFTIKPGVQVFGGFAGIETSTEERNFAANLTILSGNIGDQASNEDNVFTVVSMPEADGQTTLDGFTITGGMASDLDRNKTIATTAGALYISGSADAYGPVISNCIFIGNQARFGGAVFVDAQHSSSTPFFNNCVFTNNKADFRGGAIYLEATDGQASPILSNCTFTENKADRGACLFNVGTRGSCTPRLMECTFSNNQALTDGAVMFNDLEGSNGKVQETMTGCHIADNDSYLGNDIASSFKVTAKQQSKAPSQTGGTLRAIN